MSIRMMSALVEFSLSGALLRFGRADRNVPISEQYASILL
jgi:hypothetical protein